MAKGVFRRRFSRLTRKRWVGTSAGANVSVTPGTASLTLTTFAPTVLTPRLVTPETASLTLTTFAPTVTVNTTVTPGTASLTITTFAPTVSTPVVVTPGTASLTITTFAPTVTGSVGVTVEPGTASLVITTYQPTVIYPAPGDVVGLRGIGLPRKKQPIVLDPLPIHARSYGSATMDIQRAANSLPAVAEADGVGTASVLFGHIRARDRVRVHAALGRTTSVRGGGLTVSHQGVTVSTVRSFRGVGLQRAGHKGRLRRGMPIDGTGKILARRRASMDVRDDLTVILLT